MAFSPQQLLPFLPDEDVNCHVAYSGGMDSHVLLHALCALKQAGQFKAKLAALHVNHGLSSNAQAWVKHCQSVCDSFNVPLIVEEVRVEKDGKGLEDAARNKRLAVFSKAVEQGGYVFTAHHLDDQAETLLFRLLRGTGLRGMSGMALERPLGNGKMSRPLLHITREALASYAREHSLEWIEDESNSVVDFDRNYLRQKVMPLLGARWPGFQKNWQRFAQLAEEGELLQKELGSQDLGRVLRGIHKLDLSALQQFNGLRQRNIVRSWFLQLEQSQRIPAPDFNVIEQIFQVLIPAQQDAIPVVSWGKAGQRFELRRFASHLYIVLPQTTVPESGRMTWNTANPCRLPGELGTLVLVESDGEGVALVPGDILEVGFKQGGEQLKPAGRKTRALKKILPDYDVPPWLRPVTPLIYHDNALIAVADLFICDKYMKKSAPHNNKKLYKFQWQREDLHCGY